MNNSMIIIDESQNATLPILKMALTRIGTGSKMILTGDVTQIDLSKETDSGLQKCASNFENVDDIATISLTNRDVVRCKIVKDIVKAFEKEGSESPGKRPRSGQFGGQAGNWEARTKFSVNDNQYPVGRLI